MSSIWNDFFLGIDSQDGYLLARSITPASPTEQPDRFRNFARNSSSQRIDSDIRHATSIYSQVGLSKSEHLAWVEVYLALWKAANAILDAEEVPAQTSSRGNGGVAEHKQTPWGKAYRAWVDVANALIRGYSNGSFPAWSIPCLYVAGNNLKKFAANADQEAVRLKGSVTFNEGLQDDVVGDEERTDNLEDAGRQIMRIFNLCLNDRASIEESRKWAAYYVSNLQLKTYFKLNRISLCKNVLRALHATDLPALSQYPKSHIATFSYYIGVINFLEESYATAETHLVHAYTLCTSAPRSSPAPRKNLELILTYLIPTRLLTSHTLPTVALLAPYPNLQRLFAPLCKCIKRGDLAGFDAALARGQEDFVKRRIYLTLERGRDVALRNLFRKVFVAGGFDESGKERRTRVPLAEFVAALRVGLKMRDAEVDAFGVEREEVECLIANLIYKNLMKGYIARTHEKVVLSRKGDAFPGTGV